MGLDARSLVGRRAPETLRPPGTCVHCGAATSSPAGLCCPRCLAAWEVRRAVVEGFRAAACPTCGAPEFFDCCEDLPHVFHASRIALALRGRISP